ncbi:CCHC-type domain-containing protein [Trichonephila clavipes]|nr:CCHC-type domain-containing protein [Trichonephila clavipes]
MKARQPQDFFLLLGQQGNKAVLDWVMKEGLIPSRYECPKCKKDMRLVERKGTIDGFEWRCRVQSKENPHFVCRSEYIIGSKDYEEFVRDQLSVILEERLERESKEKIQQQREFELEKMRLEIERSRFDPENLSSLKTSVSDLIKIIPNFDIRDGDIALFLTLFERQAKRIGVEKTNWVSALLARMPPDITQLIARESEDKFDNYDYIKGVLLKRFKMSPQRPSGKNS